MSKVSVSKDATEFKNYNHKTEGKGKKNVLHCADEQGSVIYFDKHV